MRKVNSQDYMERAEHTFYQTYHRFPIVFQQGKGMHLYDTEGKEYLDFCAGIAVMGLGYQDDIWNQAVKTQIDHLVHTSNLFYNIPSVDAAEKLLSISLMDRVFFTNSGTEAIEGAIKIAKRYAYNKSGKHNHEIIAMNHSFHGRTLGALSVTGNSKYQEPFQSLIPGIRFADFNSIESVKAVINEQTCGILLEPIQGEGGIYPAEADFLKELKRLCQELDILLIFDEVQCGMGRTGSMFAWQHYGVKPDVMTTAKALGNGIPVGAFLACGKAAEAMVPGDHGSTYGGNPLATAAVSSVIDIYKERNLLEHVKEVGLYLEKQLEDLRCKYSVIKGRRGIGLMQGLELAVPAGGIVRECLLDEQLILITAGPSVIRIVPPLIVKKEDVDEMIQRLERVMKKQ